MYHLGSRPIYFALLLANIQQVKFVMFTNILKSMSIIVINIG